MPQGISGYENANRAWSVRRARISETLIGGKIARELKRRKA
jgi:hypothetical protein